MKHRYFQFILFSIYMLVMTGVMIGEGVGITPDRYALLLLLGSILIIKKTRQFLIDWIPFLFILISYDFLRSLVGKFNARVHYVEAFYADKSFFGQIPTITLQNLYYKVGQLNWYDYVATVLYLLHFALPLFFGFMLWFKNRRWFQEFTLGLVLLSYAGWVTFLVYPEAPPWLTSQEGYIPHVTQITTIAIQSLFPQRINVPTIYQTFDPNPVAAIPSMHVAYPMLILLFALSFYKKKGLIFLPYVVAISVAVIYLGEHYFVDIALGFIYAFIFFALAKLIMNHTIVFNPIKKFFKGMFVYQTEGSTES